MYQNHYLSKAKKHAVHFLPIFRGNEFAVRVSDWLVGTMTSQCVRFSFAAITIAGHIFLTGCMTPDAKYFGTSYYVTIKEMHSLGDDVYTRKLRVGGNVEPGSIRQRGTHTNFRLVQTDPKNENRQVLEVSYNEDEPPPDTFKDNAQILVMGKYGKDGVFQAYELQTKCTSKYAPRPQS